MAKVTVALNNKVQAAENRFISRHGLTHRQLATFLTMDNTLGSRLDKAKSVKDVDYLLAGAKNITHSQEKTWIETINRNTGSSDSNYQKWTKNARSYTNALLRLDTAAASSSSPAAPAPAASTSAAPAPAAPAPVESNAPEIPTASQAQEVTATTAANRRRKGGRPVRGLAGLMPSISRPTILGS